LVLIGLLVLVLIGLGLVVSGLGLGLAFFGGLGLGLFLVLNCVVSLASLMHAWLAFAVALTAVYINKKIYF